MQDVKKRKKDIQVVRIVMDAMSKKGSFSEFSVSCDQLQ